MNCSKTSYWQKMTHCPKQSLTLIKVISMMVPLTERERIEILMMVGYGIEVRIRLKAFALFNS